LHCRTDQRACVIEEGVRVRATRSGSGEETQN
jgi:hypothetical protein